MYLKGVKNAETSKYFPERIHSLFEHCNAFQQNVQGQALNFDCFNHVSWWCCFNFIKLYRKHA